MRISQVSVFVIVSMRLQRTCSSKNPSCRYGEGSSSNFWELHFAQTCRPDRLDETFPCLISHYFYKLPQRRRSSHPSQFPHLTLHVGTKRSAILIILVIERIFCYPRESQTPIPWHLCPDVTYGYYAPQEKHALAINNRPCRPRVAQERIVPGGSS